MQIGTKLLLLNFSSSTNKMKPIPKNACCTGVGQETDLLSIFCDVFTWAAQKITLLLNIASLVRCWNWRDATLGQPEVVTVLTEKDLLSGLVPWEAAGERSVSPREK
jgi:hypothetical protein